MRSRYTAFVVGDEDYLFRTWHPRTRPEGPYCHPGTQWTGLTIHETVGGGEDDETGIVEFTATYRSGDGRGGVVDDALRERSPLHPPRRPLALPRRRRIARCVWRSGPASVSIRSTQPASVTTIFPIVRPLSMRR